MSSHLKTEWVGACRRIGTDAYRAVCSSGRHTPIGITRNRRPRPRRRFRQKKEKRLERRLFRGDLAETVSAFMVFIVDQD